MASARCATLGAAPIVTCMRSREYTTPETRSAMRISTMFMTFKTLGIAAAASGNGSSQQEEGGIIMPINDERENPKSKSSDDSTWKGGPCRGPVEGYTWQEALEARDRQIIEDGKRLQKYYEQREAMIEKHRLADLRKWQEEESARHGQNWGVSPRH